MARRTTRQASHGVIRVAAGVRRGKRENALIGACRGRAPEGIFLA